MDTDVLFFCFAFVLVRVAFPLPAGLFPEQLPGLTLFIIVVYTYIVNNFLSRHGPVAGLWFLLLKAVSLPVIFACGSLAYAVKRNGTWAGPLLSFIHGSGTNSRMFL